MVMVSGQWSVAMVWLVISGQWLVVVTRLIVDLYMKVFANIEQ